jgi:hypothetical protein
MIPVSVYAESMGLFSLIISLAADLVHSCGRRSDGSGERCYSEKCAGEHIPGEVRVKAAYTLESHNPLTFCPLH